MGIKKDVFLRDCVRTKVAWDKQYMTNLYSELSTISQQFKGNIEGALNFVLQNESKFPLLANPPIIKEDLRKAIQYYRGLTKTFQVAPPIDLLEQARKGRAPLPRGGERHEAAAESRQIVKQRAPQHTDFFQYLNSEKANIYSLFSDEDIKAIINIFNENSGLARETEEIFKIIKTAYLRNALESAPVVMKKIESMGVVPPAAASIPRYASAFKVVLSYIDTLDRGF